MRFFYCPDITESGVSRLNPEESKHCFRILRKKISDTIEVVDGKGNLYQAEIISDKNKSCQFKIISHTRDYGKRGFRLSIGIAPPKNVSRFEWFLEKSVEIGIDEVYPVISKRSERTNMNSLRLSKILIGAMKQSARAYLPILHDPYGFAELITIDEQQPKQKFIAVCSMESLPHLKNVYQKEKNTLVLIGPEGDFTDEEVQLAIERGFSPVSLGNSRLRVETAGIVACDVINLAES